VNKIAANDAQLAKCILLHAYSPATASSQLFLCWKWRY